MDGGNGIGGEFTKYFFIKWTHKKTFVYHATILPLTFFAGHLASSIFLVTYITVKFILTVFYLNC